MSPQAGAAHTRASLSALCVGLGSLYLAQGVVAGLGTVLVALMAAQGQSLEAQAGVLAWGALPWVLKVVWALAWDKLAPPGHARRFWGLVALQLAVAATALALSSGDWSQGAPIAFFALNLAASWQDVAADSVAVDHTPPTRRGLVNAVMAGARALGAGWLGAIVLYPLLGTMGVAPALRVYAIGLAALALALLPLKTQLTQLTQLTQPGPPSTRAHTSAPTLREVVSMIATTPGARFAFALAGVALLGDGISGAVAVDFLQKRAGWTLEALTTQLVPLQVGAEVAAFVLAAWTVDRLGHLRAVGLASLCLGLAWAIFGGTESLWTSHGAVLGLTIVESSARAVLLVGAYGLLMGATAPTARATHFVLYMSLLNLPRVLGPWIAPSLYAQVGYMGIWLSAAGLQLGVAAFALWGSRTGALQK